MQGTATQSERFSEELKRIKPDVTAEDRAIAMDEFKISNASTTRYLNGDVRNNDLAASLITLFKRRIAQRNKALH